MGKDIEKGPCVYTTDESPGYDQELYEFMFDTARKNMAFGEYGMLHRLNLIDIQNDLAECRSTIWKHKGASKTVREMLRLTLRDYVQAIRDYDYMTKMTPCKYHDARDWKDGLIGKFKKIASEPNDPYGAMYMALEEIKLPFEDTLRTFLDGKLLAYRPEEDSEKATRFEDKDHLRQTQPKETSRFMYDFVFFLLRFFITIITGASLIVPMVIMTLDKSQTKSLVTTSVAVLLVAGLLAYLKARTFDIITIITTTAAYAAVLVVFVGLSS